MKKRIQIMPFLFTQIGSVTASEQSLVSLTARDEDLNVRVFEPRIYSSITNVDSILVGHETVIEGDDVR
ncbi:MAG: hypothetical protein CMD92_03335 [Gammaproteobacteria bacterium]|nr:hypothetical protein [Gammaproteobacteria bacterium]HBW83912.1 hypothetical protein [Gammaproteobacteria bacterium]